MIYISCDVETDGPIPGEFSMLSLGAVAFNEEGIKIDTFYSNLLPLPNAKQDPKTMQWWQTEKEAWELTQENQQQPEKTMSEFLSWLKSFNEDVKLIGYPLPFDFMFIVWYLVKFTGKNPLGHNGIDIRSYYMGRADVNFDKSSKNYIPNELHSTHPHTHHALDDAIGQGELFFNIKKPKS